MQVSITTADVRRWAEHLKESEGLSGGTVRHHLDALSNLYKRARGERMVPSGYNPVGDLLEKPKARRVEARWFEVPDAALLVEAARLYRPDVKNGARASLPFAYELVATFLLTGGRESETLGLEVGDVSLDRDLVTFRPNDWRTAQDVNVAPFGAALATAARDPGALPRRAAALTPPVPQLSDGRRGDGDGLSQAPLDAVAARACWTAGEIRSKMFRHTYCAARLQTLDQGAPVSVYTVAKELGHGGESMVRRVYGHLGQVRQRSDVVESLSWESGWRRCARGVLAPPLTPRR